MLKHGDTFAVLDRHGDIDPFGGGELGLYHQGTRFLSRLTLALYDRRPLLLSSTVKEENDVLAVDLTNHDIHGETGELVLPRGTLHLFRSKFLWQGTCYERLRVRNYGRATACVPIVVGFEADFCDIFEVRGKTRPKRGRRLESEPIENGLVLVYEGLDGLKRRTRFEWSAAPRELAASEVQLEVELEPQGETTVFLRVSCETDEDFSPASRSSYDVAYRAANQALRSMSDRTTSLHTSNEQFNDWLNRSLADLHMMVSETPYGLYPYAGVPWFSTVFGRDGIITAFECLWLNPEIARGVLAYLAATQATEKSPERDAEPGKILHETRGGEMAALGEIPFGRYYGTVDATPLFVMLAGAYYQWTGDRPFLESIWSNVENALEWMDSYGDIDGDGFIEYERKSPHGLVNQGWKDSNDSIFHADGSLATPPIALSEVQAYVYAAKRGAADMAHALGREDQARRLLQEADHLRSRFEDAFWCEDLQTYALALDGKKRPCRVRSSNVGHCLFAGIASAERAEKTAGTLLSEASFSGWGVRTLAADESRYNPMSYHNGSVWPHDNALLAQGLARYGLKDQLLRVVSGLFDSSLFADLHRLPELFCGFPRRPGEGPTLYPLACAPQAWATAAVFLLLQACLGMSVLGNQAQLRFLRPLLPPFLDRVKIRKLRVGSAVVDVTVERYAADAGINVSRREGEVEVLIVK